MRVTELWHWGCRVSSLEISRSRLDVALGILLQMALLGHSWGREGAEDPCSLILQLCETPEKMGLGSLSLVLCAVPSFAAPRAILSLAALTEDGAELLYAQHGFSEAYCNPGRIHSNPEQSDITTLMSRAVQLRPCGAVPTLRKPLLQQSSCFCIWKNCPKHSRAVQNLPSSGLLLLRSVFWSRMVTGWGHAFTRARTCMYFSLSPFYHLKYHHAFCLCASVSAMHQWTNILHDL